MNWITKINTVETSGALYKPNQMVAEIAETIGFKVINYYNVPNMMPSYTIMDTYISAWFGMVRPGDLVVVQFPDRMLNYQYFPRLMEYLHKIDEVKIVAFVHDIPTYFEEETYFSENRWLQALRGFDALIVHNEKMANQLRQDGVDVPMVKLGVFDFLYDGPVQEKHFDTKAYLVTGRRVKDLVRMTNNLTTKFEIFGNVDKQKQDNLIYRGSHPEEKIIAEIDGGFGIVSITGGMNLSNSWNFYGTLNNPFKLSFYLAAGIPIVVGKDSAHAMWIENENIGLAVDSMAELDHKLNNLSEVDYLKMIDNVKPIRDSVISGFFTKRALLEVIAILRVDFYNNF
ncbi:hypothetical protein ESZ50_11460 [Weissella muntiaci]|uniref:Beta-1,6-galactofuranosyltransferase n=1 Tax=Weissella muntiaci TaxID=2508881 RepID=A0A6C2C194_9LACO|nr:hypothetical protein [Weissella muntiaci]TYC47758.1 hypothetical protein ESZ50_11460 [Weissella muntiaci]